MSILRNLTSFHCHFWLRVSCRPHVRAPFSQSLLDFLPKLYFNHYLYVLPEFTILLMQFLPNKPVSLSLSLSLCIPCLYMPIHAMQFVRGKKEETFCFLHQKWLCTREAKLRIDIHVHVHVFVGLQIRRLLGNEKFPSVLSDI